MQKAKKNTRLFPNVRFTNYKLKLFSTFYNLKTTMERDSVTSNARSKNILFISAN